MCIWTNALPPGAAAPPNRGSLAHRGDGRGQGKLDHDDLYHRITRGLAEAYAHGTAALRSHVDWTEPPFPLAWSVMGEAAAAWSDRLTLQRAALGSLDLLNDPAHGPGLPARGTGWRCAGGFVYRIRAMRNRWPGHLRWPPIMG